MATYFFFRGYFNGKIKEKVHSLIKRLCSSNNFLIINYNEGGVEEMDKYRFGDFIYNLRKQKGLTQEELGRKLKVTNKAVSKWETGETLPDIQLLEPLASALGVTIDELLTQEKPEPIKVMVKPSKVPYIVLGSLCFLLLVFCIGVSLSLLKRNETPTITVENAEEYFLITPCEKSEVSKDSLTIYGSIYEVKDVSNAYLELHVTIQYFYVNTSGSISEILYIDRIVTYNDTTNDFSIRVEPKNSLTNFSSFSGFYISYEIVEVSGDLA